MYARSIAVLSTKTTAWFCSHTGVFSLFNNRVDYLNNEQSVKDMKYAIAPVDATAAFYFSHLL